MPDKKPAKKTAAKPKAKAVAKPKAKATPKPKVKKVVAESAVKPVVVAAPPVVEATPVTPRHRHHFFRQFIAGTCVLLAAIGMVLSVYAVFLERAILNTEVYTANMAEIIKQPVVKKAVAKVAAEELFTALDIQKRVIDILPEKVKFAGAPAVAWLQGFAQQEIEVLLDQKQFQDIWVKVNRSTHKTVVSVLRGEPGNITLTNDGSVYVDILPIIKDLALQFTEGTKIYDLVKKIPDGTSGSELRLDLGKALSISLPEDFGRVKVVQAKELIQARQAVMYLEAAAKWLPWATLGFIAGAVLISAGRRKTIMELSLGIAAASVIGGLAVNLAVQQGLLMVADDNVRQLIAVIVEIEIRGLVQIFWYIAAAGAAIWVVAYIAGKRIWFVRLDNWIRGYTGYATPEDNKKHPIINWVNINVNALRRWVLFISVIVLLLIGGWWGVAAFGVLLAVGEAKLRYLTGWTPFN